MRHDPYSPIPRRMSVREEWKQAVLSLLMPIPVIKMITVAMVVGFAWFVLSHLDITVRVRRDTTTERP